MISVCFLHSLPISLFRNPQRVQYVAFIAIGATCVGSVVLEPKFEYKTDDATTTNTAFKRGDEFGYFQFGGSTIVMMFQS
jgi:phosphatidylserine decarboxylase